MKTGIYVRVSTEEQAKEGYSIRAQQEKLKDYIKLKGWELYKVYPDEGVSGKNIIDRTALNELLNDIMTGKVDNVLIYKIDRLTRSVRDLIELVDIFGKYNCEFTSFTENIDTQSATGRMFLKILGIFAEFERESIIERVTLACEKKVKEGYSLCSRYSSFGYDRENGNKIQNIDEKESDIVREIFDMYLKDDMSQYGIALELNARKISTKTGTTWTSDKVRNVLSNVNYIGKVRYAINDPKRHFVNDGKHEPIISEELFLQAQEKLQRLKRKIVTKRPRDDNYFAGSVYCGICGKKLVTHNAYRTKKDGTEAFYGLYKCSNKPYKQCDARDMSHSKVEVAFKDYIGNINDLSVKDEVELKQEQLEKDKNNKLRIEYTGIITKLEKKEKDIMTLYINEKIGFDEYTSMIKIITSEKHIYEEKLKEIPVDTPIDLQILREDIMTNVKENWEHLSNKERLQFLHVYIDKIYAVNDAETRQVKIKRIEFCKSIENTNK